VRQEVAVASRWRPALLAALLVSTVWVGWASFEGRQLRGAPIVLVGPDVVTVPLAEQLQNARGPAVVVHAESDAREAREDLAHGRVLGLLTLDLASTVDLLVLPANLSRDLDRFLVDEVRAEVRMYDRTVRIERSPDGSADAGGSPLLAMGAVALGFLIVSAISVVRGPMAPTLATGVLRFFVLLGGSLVLAAGLGVTEHGVSAAWALGLACLGAGTVTLVCELVSGLRALVAAAFLLAVVPMPLVVAGDRWLLAQPWSSVSNWALVGAASEAHPGLRAWLVLLGTPLLSIVLLLGARAVGRGRHRELAKAGDADGAVRRGVVAVAVGSVVFTVLSYSGWVALAAQDAVTPTPSLASTTRCLQTGQIRDVADLNRVVRLRGSPAMRGGDVGASAQLQDGRMLWMFGDTVRDGDLRGGPFVRNSMVTVAPDCLGVVLPESGGAVIPNRDHEVGYWPMSVLVSERPGYDLVIVTAQRVRTVDATDVFGFENLGPAVVIYFVPAGETPQLVSVTDVSEDRADVTRPMWGAATAVHDGMAYLYGTARPNDIQAGTGFSLAVARVPVAHVSDETAWEYWTGSTWGVDQDLAATLIRDKDGVSQTLSVFKKDDRWFALSKRNEFLGQDVVIWSAPAPTGPFLPNPPVTTLPFDAASGVLRYMPLAHPDLLPRPDTVVMSYSRNRTDASEVRRDPREYRPRFLRVRLPTH